MNVLADTSTWINHLLKSNPSVEVLLAEGRMVTHTFVHGELSLGSVRLLSDVGKLLEDLERIPMATSREIFELIENKQLYGKGIGLVDVYLLAGCLIDGRTKLLTADKRLAKVAHELGVAF